jgi:hypothetical protein
MMRGSISKEAAQLFLGAEHLRAVNTGLSRRFVGLQSHEVNLLAPL